jgi:hypothetical protein
MYTLKEGAWNDPEVWSLNRVPNGTDTILLKHAITIPNGYNANAQKIRYDTNQRLSIGTNSKLTFSE